MTTTQLSKEDIEFAQVNKEIEEELRLEKEKDAAILHSLYMSLPRELYTSIMFYIKETYYAFNFEIVDKSKVYGSKQLEEDYAFDYVYLVQHNWYDCYSGFVFIPLPSGDFLKMEFSD